MRAWATRRKRAQLLAQLTEKAKTRYVQPYAFALVHLGLGEKEQALDWLEKAVEERRRHFLQFYQSRSIFRSAARRSKVRRGCAKGCRARSHESNFFAELKRRNVYKVAIAYAVVGWLLIQIATQIFPFFEIPNWGVRLMVLIIALGFPIALDYCLGL